MRHNLLTSVYKNENIRNFGPRSSSATNSRIPDICETPCERALKRRSFCIGSGGGTPGRSGVLAFQNLQDRSLERKKHTFFPKDNGIQQRVVLRTTYVFTLLMGFTGPP